MRAERQLAQSRLVAQIAAGDRGALQALYEIYFPHLACFFSHLTAATVEDLINDTFFDVWKKSGELVAAASSHIWIMRLALYHARLQQPTAATDQSAIKYLVYTGSTRAEVAEILSLSTHCVDALLTQTRLATSHRQTPCANG
ncbi:MAG: hypothetical protein JSR66_22910 [Proteobacteria bacterium]|nr:hypothetical protein [Pseudomonadota bacterium]